jgi:quinoprotein glucose dehydrogenase
VYRLTPGDPKQTDFRYVAGGPGKLNDLMTVDGLPLFKPPYARVTAIDMNKGEHLWVSPLGNGPRNHPLLKGLALPPLGDGIHGGSVLVTKTLLFVTVLHLQYDGAPAPPAWEQWGDADAARKVLYVFDKRTGALLRVFDMDGMAAAAPMTYLSGGKQFIVVAVGAGPSAELVAFSLPGAVRN